MTFFQETMVMLWMVGICRARNHVVLVESVQG